ncbi:MAG: hypothetical protein AAGF74_08245 [Pseudomonadota bacterium]
MSRIALFGTTLWLALVGGAQAYTPIAEIICAPSDEMRERIMLQYGQRLQSSGVRDPDSMVEVWSSDRGRWTLVIAYASGNRCIVAMGQDWNVEPAPPA